MNSSTVRALVRWSILLALSLPGLSNAALLSRLDGAAAYDTVLGITWVTDAGLAQERSLQWAPAVAWVDSLDYLGFSDWRLPSVDELSYMFFQNMGGTERDTLGGQQVVDDVLLTGIYPFSPPDGGYWSSTLIGGDTPFSALILSFNGGSVDGDFDDHGYFAHLWPVRSGDISAIPEPRAIVLVCVGLAGLYVIRRSLEC